MRRRGIMLAMEDDAVVVDSDSMSELQAEVEAGSSESQDQATEVDDISTAIEEAVEDTETLGDIQDVMEDKIESGEGLSPDAAEIADIAIESICMRLGVAKSNVMPALESFGSTNSRVAATRIACEGLKEMIVNAWKAVKKAFLFVWQKIKDFYQSFFSNTEKVAELAKAIKKEAGELGSTKIKDIEIEVGSVASMFRENKKSSKDIMLKILDNQTSLSNNSVSIVDISTELVSTFNKVANAPKGASTIVKEAKAEVEAIIKVLDGANGSKKTDDGIEIGPFIEGQTYVFKVSGKNALSISLTNKTSDEVESKKLATLKSSEITSVCDEVIKLMEVTAAFKKKQTNVENINKAFVKLADANINAASALADASEDNSDSKAFISEIKTSAGQLNSLSSRLCTMLPSQNVRAGKAALKYAKASIDAHEKKEDDKK